MNCKCGSDSYEGHIEKVEQGYAGHTYSGHYWAPTEDEK